MPPVTSRCFSDLKQRWRFPIRLALPALLLAVVLFFAVAGSAKTEPPPGWKAFTTGDHKKAEAIWQPLAEQGDYHAAFGMGVLSQTRDQQNFKLITSPAGV